MDQRRHLGGRHIVKMLAARGQCFLGPLAQRLSGGGFAAAGIVLVCHNLLLLGHLLHSKQDTVFRNPMLMDSARV